MTDIHRASSLGWSVMDRGKFMSFQSCITIPGYFFAGRVITRLGTMPSMLAGLASTLVENIFCGLANRSWHHYAARPVGFLRPSAVAALNACKLPRYRWHLCILLKKPAIYRCGQASRLKARRWALRRVTITVEIHNRSS